MNIFNKLKENDINCYFGLKEKLSPYEINTIILSSQIISKYYKNKTKIENVDHYIDYVFWEHILKITQINIEDILEERKEVFLEAIDKIGKLKENYKMGDFTNYLSNHYKDILSYLENEEINFMKWEIKEDFLVKINKYLSKNTVHGEIVEYLLEKDIILIFDNISMFNKYKKDLLIKLSSKEKLKQLITFRYNEVLKFLKENHQNFKDLKEYSDIINILIDNVLDGKQPIYQREKECSQLIALLKNNRDTRVRRLMKLHIDLKKELNKYVQKHGIPISQKIDLKEAMLDYTKNFKDGYYNDYSRLLHINTVNRDDENEEGKKKLVLTIETVDKTDIGLTAALFGEHYYYASVRIMQVQAYINIFNRFFYGITIKKMGYRRLEQLLNRLINQIFQTLNIEYTEQEVKNDIKGVFYAIKVPLKKYSSKAEKNYNYYINSFYIISYIEKILRKIYIAVNEEYIYFPEDKITLAQLLEEQSNEKLKILVGKNLFKWLKYFLCNITSENEIRNKKIGYDYRNLMAHYRDLQTVNIESIAIHNIVVYLFINLIEGLHLNIIDYPCEETEKIIEQQILKDNTFETYIQNKITK